MEALTPSQVKDFRSEIDDKMVEAVNSLLLEKRHTNPILIKQEELIRAYRLVCSGKGVDMPRSEVFKSGVLNIEEAFKKKGWLVEYDKPAYNETYEPYFTFKYK